MTTRCRCFYELLQLSCRSVIPTCRSLPAAQPPPEPQAPCASCARPAGYVPCSLPGCFSRAPVRSLPPASGALAGVAAPKHRGVLFHAAHRAISLVTDFPKSPPVTSSPGKRWPAPMGRGSPLLRSPGAAVGRGHRCSPELLPATAARVLLGWTLLVSGGLAVFQGVVTSPVSLWDAAA